MNITHIIPGSGGTFYCENCVRDSSIIPALRARGHDVTLVPMYLPLFGHEEADTATQLFFGGINTWLQQRSALFRTTPRWLDRILDSRWMLRVAAERAGSTRPSSLGDMTVSMLRGPRGRQSKELERLTRFLARAVKPDVIHLSNALLLGLASRLKEQTGASIVCTLQDEAPWVDAMGSPWTLRVWEAMRDQTRHVDAFIAVSNAYADEIEKRLDLDRERLHVVHIGIDAASYPQAPMDFTKPVIGYMARMSEGCGLGLLIDAFSRLKTDPAFRDMKLHVTGGKTHDDDRFLKGVRRLVRAEGIQDDVVFVEDFDNRARRSFLEGLTALSVPGGDQSAFGLYMLEAMAAGVPVVQPDIGAFREIVAITGGGVIYDSRDPTGLLKSLKDLLADEERARELGRRAREGVTRHFSLDGMARQFMGIYTQITGGSEEEPAA